MKTYGKTQVLSSSIKRLSLLGLAAIMLMGTLGCSKTAPGDSAALQQQTAKETAAAQTILQVNGSTSVEKLMTMLSDRYTAKNPGVSLQIQAPGSSAGIKAVHDGNAQIGMSSRELKGDELTWGFEGNGHCL